MIFHKSPPAPRPPSLTPSYLLKVTKFLVKTSQSEFLVMTEKKIFAYQLFVSLNISDFSLFYVKTENYFSEKYKKINEAKTKIHQHHLIPR